MSNRIVMHHLLWILLPLWATAVVNAQPMREEQNDPAQYQPVDAEFAFTRLVFESGIQMLPGPGNSAWRDWPDGDRHFIEGVSRLTIADIDRQSHALDLFDERIFDHPWLYALEVGTWILSPKESANLREYLLRGGFLVIDDFHGSVQWAGFERTMKQVFPDRPIVDISPSDEILNIFYNIDTGVQIPGTMGLRNGGYEHDGFTPHWRGIYDDKGRLMVMINFNMDLGDAWELADSPQYPAHLTTLAYRYGVNYVIYGMTH